VVKAVLTTQRVSALFNPANNGMHDFGNLTEAHRVGERPHTAASCTRTDAKVTTPPLPR
jgi:hypothetical protein